MISTILKWGILIISFKILTAFLVGKLGTDPRRDISVKEQLLTDFKANTVFIGSSRTLYGVDPQLFDSLYKGYSRSYNLGLFSLSPSNSFKIAHKIIEENTEIKTIFIELNALDYSTVLASPDNIFQEVVFRTGVLSNCNNISFSEKAKSFLPGFNHTMFQSLSIAPEIFKLKKHLHPSKDPVEGSPDLTDQGNQVVKLSITKTDKFIQENLLATREMATISKSPTMNSYYVMKIKELIKLAESRNKKMIFYFPNSLAKSEVLVLSEVIPFIPKSNLIRLPGDQTLDQLFTPNNLFDSHHLNQKGATVYTSFLCNEAKMLMK